jgi:hypothetical protein
MNLLPEEHSIKESMDKSFWLTSHRLCAEHEELGQSYTQYVFLEDISSAGIQRSSQSWYLVMGLFLFLAGMLLGRNTSIESTILAVFLLVFFVAMYMMSRKSYIVVKAPGTRVQINVTQMPQDTILQFLQEIEEAKNNRLQALRNAVNNHSV